MIHDFVKMHGLGNDFVILDGRSKPFTLSAQHARLLANRRYGIGCDQVIYLEAPQDPRASLLMRILNADGCEVNACGNGTRCVGALLAEETGQHHHLIQTAAGLLETTIHEDQTISVDLGVPSLRWQDIPLSQETDTLYIPLMAEGVDPPTAVSVGNPHVVFFTQTPDQVDLQRVGEQLNRHPLFPKGTNVEVVTIQNRHTARMRVYERGTGITPACATGACAALVAAKHRGLMDSPATLHLDGGSLQVIYDQTVRMRGNVHLTFKGQFDLSLFAA